MLQNFRDYTDSTALCKQVYNQSNYLLGNLTLSKDKNCRGSIYLNYSKRMHRLG